MILDFRAFVVDTKDNESKWAVKKMKMKDLTEGDVTIKVAYSGVNYKDAMVANNVIKHPNKIIPGIDLAGTVIDSTDEKFKKGDSVIVTSYQLGVSHYGGYSEIARVPVEWVVPLPKGLTLKEAMILGTAGFTAALSVNRLIESGVTPEKGPILVTGATGGGGSIAVDILSKIGYKVAASTAKKNEHSYLLELGAQEILDRNEIIAQESKGFEMRKLEKEKWAGVVDPVGGKTTEYVLTAVKYGGSIALSGLAGGNKILTTVYPFILRGINLLGIDSVNYPMEERVKIWNLLASTYKPTQLGGSVVNEITLEELPAVLSIIMEGKVRGRTLVKL